MPVLGYMSYLFIIILHIIRHVGTFKFNKWVLAIISTMELSQPAGSDCESQILLLH
jgi:hypothetical protein